ncbi:hypothetical protein Airi01_043090 [Actinoallomurus iriomotensis]|uniref:Uncharacterized protein n=1 Tax=Actinoallomurus iriomotensis TaxID=478107 RepID=A0A9W6VR12_9ACTN|nr:hypothetical protein Airi01_043090 [Actinoallomurus iriomotensis]
MLVVGLCSAALLTGGGGVFTPWPAALTIVAETLALPLLAYLAVFAGAATRRRQRQGSPPYRRMVAAWVRASRSAAVAGGSGGSP